jgi:hypothetical protein
MTDGFEEARSQRNWLERLGDKIPGFRGFQNRELRRDVDKLQREHISHRLTQLKTRVREKAGRYTDAGRIGSLQPFDRIEKRLEGLSQTVRFSDYGATGLFDPVKIKEAELERLYRFDLSVLQDLEALDAAVTDIPDPGADDPGPALDGTLARLSDLEGKWAERKTVITDVVQVS